MADLLSSLFNNKSSNQFTNQSFSLPDFITKSKAIIPKNSQIVSYSAYNTPLDNSEGRVSGSGRGWGQASGEVKMTVIDEILNQARERAYSRDQVAFFLAVGYKESGLNPDAAAASTSASGIAQFVKKTGEACGVSVEERFDFKESIGGLFTYMGRILNKSEANSQLKTPESVFTDAYSRYHDGGKPKNETIEWTKKNILPIQEKFSQWLTETGLYPEPDLFDKLTTPKVDLTEYKTCTL